MTTEKIDPDEAHAHVASGALLVCAYDSEAQCAENRIPGALTLHELQAIESRLPEDQELIFYCA